MNSLIGTNKIIEFFPTHILIRKPKHRKHGL